MDSLVTKLTRRAHDAGDTTALVFEDGDGSRRPVTTATLDRHARRVAGALRGAGAAPGDRALLLYRPGEDYVAGFLGCLYAGVVAVPAFPPGDARGFERVLAIARHCGAKVALTDDAELAAVRERLADGPDLDWLTAEDIDGADATGDVEPLGPEALAFLQYTSGSTADPKGVMVTHGNLAHNSAVIAAALGAGPDTRAVSWLPPYHDMGLIGGILQPLHSGFPCLLMSPATFLYRPLRWLRALSEFGATATAAPDFAYAECVRRVSEADLAGLDLSRLRHVLVGAEPVRAATLESFARRFAPAGFRPEAFLPCYGLAEATLFVTGTATADRPAEVLLDRGALAADRVVRDPGGLGNVGCGTVRGADRIAVVDPATRRRTGPDTVGEVWVRGPSVTAGYWADEEATAAAFGARLDDASDTGDWLRTGDLGFLAGDQLHVTGRRKDLIVVRGANHYPQDIELTAERAHPALFPGRSAAFGLDDGTSERVVLVAEVPRDVEADAVTAAVSGAVSAEHGVALHQVVLVRRGTVPRTSSGKVRRRETRTRHLAGTLPTLATSAPPASSDPSAPDRLRALVATALDRAPGSLDPAAPLVRQGLDSLRAARLRAALSTELATDVDIADLLGTLSPDELAALVTQAPGPARAPVPVRRADEPAVLSPGQERLWLLDQLGAAAAYHLTGLLWLAGDRAGEPDPAAVAAALDVLAAEHDQLRAGVAAGPDGAPRLVTAAAAAIPVPVHEADDREHCLELTRRWRREPFDLADPPLLRAALYRVGGRGWALALCVHHLVCDGWSFGILARRFGEVYAAIRAGTDPAPAPQDLRYSDIAAWQRDRADGEELTAALERWRTRLAGATAPQLPPPEAPGEPEPFTGEVVPVHLPADVVAGLRTAASTADTTVFTVLSAAMAVVLGQCAGTSDVLLGTVAAGRHRPELAGLVGFLATTLPLRIDLDGDPTVAELLDRARRAGLAAQADAEVPFERIVRVAGGERAEAELRPLVRHVLVLQDARPVVRVAGADVPAEVLAPDGARFDLELDLAPDSDGGLSGTLTYATETVDRSTAELLVSALSTVAGGLAGAPGRRLSTLPVFDTATLARTHAFGGGGDVVPVRTPSVAEWFAATAAAAPDAVAVVDPDGTPTTYRDLAAAVDRLARRLRAHGVGPEDRVGVCLHRGSSLSVAVLGVLRSGAVYLPLDPGYPAERLAHVVADAAPSVVIATPDLAPLLPPVPVLAPDDPDDPAAGLPEILPGSAAYVVYTSGSTGLPKGAVNTHEALTNRLHWALSRHGVQPGDRVLHKTPIGFDVSVWELLLPLVAGATLVHTRPEGHRDPHHLHDVLDRQRVTLCHFVPSMLHAFLDSPSGPHPDLRGVLCSGEALPPGLAARFLERFPDVVLDNLYGPTEAAIDVSGHLVTAPVGDRLPIGGPTPGVRLSVRDRFARPQPVGVPGELYIGGVQVARGYHGKPGLTADRFRPDPDAPGERLYASGDRARWLPDGTIEFLGRLDHQVKIRGQRIEPAEVETALEAHPGVTAAVVHPRRDARGDLHLAGYVTGPASDAEDLRAFLLERLPSAMVPSAIVPLPAFPQLPSGKIDRSALPEPPSPARAVHVAPHTETQRHLAAIWSEVLGVAQVGLHDGFFQLGGHSLLAVKVLSRIRTHFAVDLAVADLLTGRPTVASLAELVEQRRLETLDAGELDVLLADLEGLSEEEAERLLAEEEGR